MDLAERAEAGLYGPDEPAWARRIEAWLDDLRAAFGWARDGGEADVAVRLAAALMRYGYWRVRPDLLGWGTWAVATVPAHRRLAVAYAAAAHAAWMDGRLDQSREFARRGVALAGGPTALAAAAPAGGARRRRAAGRDLASALEAYRGVAALAAGDLAGRAIATANQALVLTYRGDDQVALRRRPARRSRWPWPRAPPRPSPWPASPRGRRWPTWTRPPRLPRWRRLAAALGKVGNRYVAGTALTATVALRSRRPPEQALVLFQDAVQHWRSSRTAG